MTAPSPSNGGDELSLTSKFNLAVQKLLTDYGKQFTPQLDGNDLYLLASDIWDAHRESLMTQRSQDRNALVAAVEADRGLKYDPIVTTLRQDSSYLAPFQAGKNHGITTAQQVIRGYYDKDPSGGTK